MVPESNTRETACNNAPDGFDEIIELTQEEKRELIGMWKLKHNYCSDK